MFCSVVECSLLTRAAFEAGVEAVAHPMKNLVSIVSSSVLTGLLLSSSSVHSDESSAQQNILVLF